MNDEIKLKLKKAAKVGGLIAGFLAMFILGMGFGSCSEKKVQDQSSQSQSRDSGKASRGLSPKLELTDDDNLLTHAERYVNRFYWANGEGDALQLITESWGINSYVLNATYAPEDNAYVLRFTGSTGLFSIWGLPTFAINQLATGEQGYSFPASYALDILQYRWLSDDLLYFVIPSGFYSTGEGSSNVRNIYLRAVYGVELFLYDDWVWANGADVVADIYLPQDFNPMWMYGDNFQNGLFGMLAGNHDGYAYTGELPIVFRSNGSVYDGIYCYFEPIADMKYQNPVNGEIVTASHTETNYHVCTGMYYRHFGATSIHPELDASSFDLAWSPVLGLDSDGVTYLTPSAEWATDAFRTLSVLTYKETIPLSARWPSMNALELIKLKASGFVIVGDTSVYNVFDMLTGAFKSFADVMSIQILPYMTIGLLFFLPVVVGVLIALVELLKK